MPDSLFDDDDLISSYTRAQAIADGQLIDVSETAREAGIRYPVALTATVWARCVEVPAGVADQDETGRLWDVLVLLAFTARSTQGNTLRFEVHVRDDNREAAPPTVELVALCGPGDTAEPVITVMLPGED